MCGDVLSALGLGAEVRWGPGFLPASFPQDKKDQLRKLIESSRNRRVKLQMTINTSQTSLKWSPPFGVMYVCVKRKKPRKEIFRNTRSDPSLFPLHLAVFFSFSVGKKELILVPGSVLPSLCADPSSRDHVGPGLQHSAPASVHDPEGRACCWTAAGPDARGKLLDCQSRDPVLGARRPVPGVPKVPVRQLSAGPHAEPSLQLPLPGKALPLFRLFQQNRPQALLAPPSTSKRSALRLVERRLCAHTVLEPRAEQTCKLTCSGH